MKRDKPSEHRHHELVMASAKARRPVRSKGSIQRDGGFAHRAISTRGRNILSAREVLRRPCSRLVTGNIL